MADMHSITVYDRGASRYVQCIRVGTKQGRHVREPARRCVVVVYRQAAIVHARPHDEGATQLDVVRAQRAALRAIGVRIRKHRRSSIEILRGVIHPMGADWGCRRGAIRQTERCQPSGGMKHEMPHPRRTIRQDQQVPFGIYEVS
eukprot:SAG11_NODE_12292_length_710_cov_1.985270_1_plen_145_part_00